MKKLIQRDKKRRRLVTKYELDRLVLKSIIKNSYIDSELRSIAAVTLDKLPKDSSKVRVVNRCSLTGRARGVYKLYRCSRIKIKELASFGLLNGVQKSSF